MFSVYIYLYFPIAGLINALCKCFAGHNDEENYCCGLDASGLEYLKTVQILFENLPQLLIHCMFLYYHIQDFTNEQDIELIKPILSGYSLVISKLIVSAVMFVGGNIYHALTQSAFSFSAGRLLDPIIEMLG